MNYEAIVQAQATRLGALFTRAASSRLPSNIKTPEGQAALQGQIKLAAEIGVEGEKLRLANEVVVQKKRILEQVNNVVSAS